MGYNMGYNGMTACPWIDGYVGHQAWVATLRLIGALKIQDD